MKRCDDEVDQFDPDERNDYAAEAVDKEVALQNRQRAHWFVSNTAQRQRDESNNDERVEDNGAQNCARRTVQMHNVQWRDLRKRGHQHRRDDGEIFRYVVCDAEGGKVAARDEHLLSDLNEIEELRRIAVEIDHVSRLARGLRPG